MKRIFLLIALLLAPFTLHLSPLALQAQVRRPLPKFDPDNPKKLPAPELYDLHSLIISYDVEVGKKPLKRAIKRKKCEIMYDYKNFNMIAVRLPDNFPLAEAEEYFRGVRGVIHVGKNRRYELHTQPVGEVPQNYPRTHTDVQ